MLLRRALTMDDGSAIILSVAKYYSPSGKAIQDTGVTPGELVQEPEPHPRPTRTARPCGRKRISRNTNPVKM